MNISSRSWHFKLISEYYTVSNDISVPYYAFLFLTSVLFLLCSIIMGLFVLTGAITLPITFLYILLQVPGQIYYTITTDINYFALNDISLQNFFMSVLVDLSIYSVLYSLYRIGSVLKPGIKKILSVMPRVQVQDENVHKKATSTGSNSTKK